MLKNLILMAAVCILFIGTVFGQKTVATGKAFQNVEVEKFTVKDGVEFPADKLDPLTQSVVNT